MQSLFHGTGCLFSVIPCISLPCIYWLLLLLSSKSSWGFYGTQFMGPTGKVNLHPSRVDEEEFPSGLVGCWVWAKGKHTRNIMFLWSSGLDLFFIVEAKILGDLSVATLLHTHDRWAPSASCNKLNYCCAVEKAVCFLLSGSWIWTLPVS